MPPIFFQFLIVSPMTDKGPMMEEKKQNRFFTPLPQ